MQRLTRQTLTALILAQSMDVAESTHRDLAQAADELADSIGRFTRATDGERASLLNTSAARVAITLGSVADDRSTDPAHPTRHSVKVSLERGLEDVQLLVTVQGLISSAATRAEEVSSSAAESARKAEVALESARAAASEAATTALESSFDTVATEEASSARNWRRWTLVVLVLATLGGVGFLAENLSREINWQGVVFRVAIVSALGAIAAYTARQSSHHRRIATWARAIQVQLKSFRGFVERIDDQKVQDAMFEMFTRRVLAPPPESSKSGEATNLLQPLLEQVIKRVP